MKTSIVARLAGTLALLIGLQPAAQAIDAQAADNLPRNVSDGKFHVIVGIGSNVVAQYPSVPYAAGEQPLENINDAITKARELRNIYGSYTIVIDFPSTTMAMESGFELNANDSGRDSGTHPLVLRGDSGGATVLTGARTIQLSDPAVTDSYIPGAKEYTVSGAALKKHSAKNATYSNPFDLYQADTRFRPARYPAAGARWLNTGPSNPTASIASRNSDNFTPDITLPSADFGIIDNEPEIWVGGYWDAYGGYDYESSVLNGVSNGTTLNVARLLTVPAYVGSRFFLFNLKSQLPNNPGHMVVEQSTGKVTFVPLPQTTSFEVTQTDTLMSLHGVHDVVIQNIAFEKTKAQTISIESSGYITIRNCFVGHSGWRAVNIDGDSLNIAFYDDVFSDIADEAIVLGGGDHASLASSQHWIANSIFTKFGRDRKAGGAAIYAVYNSVNVNIDSNYFAHTPHNVILLQGNNHKVHGNEFYDVVKNSSDAGAIYMGASLTQRGIEIYSNYFRDFGDFDTVPDRRVYGIYADDLASGVSFHNNLFYRVALPVFLNGGQLNTGEGNVFGLVAHDKSAIGSTESGEHESDTTTRILNEYNNFVGSPLFPTWQAAYPSIQCESPGCYPFHPSGTLTNNLMFGGSLNTTDNSFSLQLIGTGNQEFGLSEQEMGDFWQHTSPDIGAVRSRLLTRVSQLPETAAQQHDRCGNQYATKVRC